MSPRVFFNFAVLACVSFLLTACSKPAPSAEAIRAVKVITIGQDNMRLGAEFAGEVKARTESRLGFRVAGKMVRRYVDVGQQVKAGQLLAQLDPQDYKLSADAARAQLSSATTNRDLAAADYKRFKDLREQNFISSAELDRREANLKAAQAQFDQAQAQATLQSNQANYTALLADVGGVVTAVDAESGQVVSAGVPVVRIAHQGPRDVVIAVPEDSVGLIKIGTVAHVRTWTNKAHYQGKVREVAASADPVTRTFIVKIAMNTSELNLGSSVSATLELDGQVDTSVIKLPMSALHQSGKTSAVWLVDANSMTIKLQPVQVATADGNDIVIASGLQPGMLVVSTGVHVLSEGQKVTLYQPKATSAQAAGAINPN